MRKPILAIALIALFSCPTMASFAGITDASSQQSRQGESQASSSAGVSNSRLIDDQPPLSKEAMANANGGGSGGAGNAGAARPAPSAATASSEEPHAQVQNYVWTK